MFDMERIIMDPISQIINAGQMLPQLQSSITSGTGTGAVNSSSGSITTAIQPYPRKFKNPKSIVPLHANRLPLIEEAKLVYPGEYNDGSNTKTPVSVLQELLCRRGVTPKYDLLQIEGAIHQPVFRYRVHLNNDFVATGSGRSKKDAKHAAAKNLLDLIVGKQNSEQANLATTPPPLSNDENTGPAEGQGDDKVMGNPVGWLQEMCMSRRWPPPLYDMENEEGLPHERLFTIACQVLKYKETGAGKSKKIAKRIAAHKMWSFLQELPPDVTKTENLDSDDELYGKLQSPAQRYSGLKDSKISKSNSSQIHKVSHFHKSLKQSTGKKINALQTTDLTTKGFNCIQFLQELSVEQDFDITYVDIEEKSRSGRFQCLVQLSTIPVAVCHGTGKSVNEAHIHAAFNALEYLKAMTKK